LHEEIDNAGDDLLASLNGDEYYQGNGNAEQFCDLCKNRNRQGIGQENGISYLARELASESIRKREYILDG